MSITEKLNQIIFKYKLDCYYPRFQKKLQAEKIIIDMALEVEENAEILLLGANQSDIDHTEGLIGRCRTVKGIVFNRDKADNLLQEELIRADRIWLISFHGAEKIVETLEERKIEFENLYDIFLYHGLILEDEYYHFLGEPYEKDYFDDIGFPRTGSKVQLEYFFVRKKYQETTNPVLQNIYLHKMLFIALYMKNFIEAEKCVNQLLHSECEVDVRSAWAEVKDLLENIRGTLLDRKCNDIVWFWMDALSYEDIEGMDYLRKIQEESISFSNAYNNAPYTTPVLRAIFCQKQYVRDRSDKIVVNKNTSELLSYLEEKDYQVKIVSGYFNSSTIVGLEAERKPEIFAPASSIFWNMLEYLVSADSSCFILAHALMETHLPCLSLKMKSLHDKKVRYDCGREELDEQLEYYSSFLDETVIRIYMSDHGHPESDFEARTHIHLNICHPRFHPRNIKEMFSVLDFYPLIKQLLERQELVIDEFTRDYVPVECLDIYNRRLLQKRNGLEMFIFGYVGMVSKDEIYLRFSVGKEFLHKRKIKHWRPFLFTENEIEDSTNLETFRELSGEYPLEILQEEKFRYSRGSHELYKIYVERSFELKQKLNASLNKLIEECPSNSVAIRMGGRHSYALYYLLEEDMKKKIGAFIDHNPHCLCAAYGKVITKEQLVEEKIDAVILSSYDYRNILREEALDYPKSVKVIDLYDVFEQMGYSFTENFFDTMGLKEEDYVTAIN